MNLTNPMPDDFEGWYVVRTRAFAEPRVKDELTAIGLDVYLPLERYETKRSRKVVVLERPLLPRYLFASIRLKGDFHRVKVTNGVESFLASADGRPRRVRESELDRLREYVQAGAFDEIGDVKKRFAAGEAVKILGGPFDGRTGRVEKGGEGRSFRVLTWVFGRSTVANMDANQLSPVAANDDASKAA